MIFPFWGVSGGGVVVVVVMIIISFLLLDSACYSRVMFLVFE